MSLRDIERESIRSFVVQAASEGYLSGRVLDYGCGKQPYRDIVESAGAKYVGYDRADFPANVSGNDYGPDWPVNADWNTILCTQVLQYIAEYQRLVQRFGQSLAKLSGTLVMTYPTNWPEVELEDLHRFTKAGMERLLIESGFRIVWHPRREIVAVTLDGENLYAGYGVVARA